MYLYTNMQVVAPVLWLPIMM